MDWLDMGIGARMGGQTGVGDRCPFGAHRGQEWFRRTARDAGAPPGFREDGKGIEARLEGANEFAATTTRSPPPRTTGARADDGFVLTISVRAHLAPVMRGRYDSGIVGSQSTTW